MSWSHWATPWPSWARPLRYPPQTLTRVSISRNSWREMTKIFLSRIAVTNFHVSFSSRFSRNGGKVPLSPLYFQDSRKISLSPLDFQDCGDQFLCILSIFKIFSLNILIINNFEKTNQILLWSYFDPDLVLFWQALERLELEDNKEWLTVWLRLHFSLSTLKVRDRNFNILSAFKIG